MFHADGWTGGRADGRRDGQTDTIKLVDTFRNFANAPKSFKVI